MPLYCAGWGRNSTIRTYRDGVPARITRTCHTSNVDTNTLIAIIVGVVIGVVIVAVAITLALGAKKKKQDAITFTEKKNLEGKERSGSYSAGGGFSFSEGTGQLKQKTPAPKKKPAPMPGPITPQGTSPEQVQVVIPKDAGKTVSGQGIAPAAPSTEATAPTVAPKESVPAEESTPTVPPASIEPEPAEPEPVEPELEPKPAESAPVEPEPAESAPVGPAAPVEQQAYPIPPLSEEPPLAPGPVTDQDVTPAEHVRPTGDPYAPADAEIIPDEGGSDDVAELPGIEEPTSTPPVEKVPSARGRLSRLRGRLSRSNNVFSNGVLGILGAGDLDEDAWEEVEDTLIMADLGTSITMRVVDRLRDELASSSIHDEAGARALLREILIEECHPELDRSLKALPHDDHPAILLMVGVNGTGKTTTTGKLARVLVGDGRRVLLGAADTFRAAAADQLETWGERVGATTIRGAEGADPAAIAFDAVDAGVEQGVDAVLIDTAGRLHTKAGLMDELGKVKRVVSKKASVDEVLLVLDATVGQNGILQAKEFKNVVDITGVVLTKLDGTAKGGIVFQVQEELGVPVKLVGLGEGADDLAPFEPAAFVDALLA